MKRNEINEWAKEIDSKFADQKTKYGAYKNKDKWEINLWHPLAKNVDVIIFDKNNPDKEIERVKGQFSSPNWYWSIEKDYDGFFYQYEITQNNGKVNIALDPFAKSMAPFNWGGKVEKVGKAAFIDWKKLKTFRKIKPLTDIQPIIYEANIRDLTSLRDDVKIPGSFNALKEAKVAEHIKELGFTSVQFLPIHNCYSLDELNKKILGKGEGTGWTTNYNWGYDPHNYFSINGWYSSNPKDPYCRMNEFKGVVEYFHDNDLDVIIDVVYNHVMTNKILNNVFPNYYFRGGDNKENIVTPVDEPPFASERIMARRIIVESLEWFIKAYDVDGFRFDLSCFIDSKTLLELTKKLRKIKPNIILHGEAWAWSDLDFKDSFIKGKTDNDVDFAYFNDTTRNAIRGEDDSHGFAPGIIGGNKKEFSNYLPAIFGNIKSLGYMIPDADQSNNSLFTHTAKNNIQYAACHDGHTMWDKINLTTIGGKKSKLEAVRQVIILHIATQGRLLFLSGSEMLHSKPNDPSGEKGENFHESDNAIDLFELGKAYNEDTYKTTDWSCGIRWKQYNGEVKTQIGDFLKKSLNFRTETKFFNLLNSNEIENALKINLIDSQKYIVDFEIAIENQTSRVIHNFGENDYFYKSNGKEILYSGLDKSIKNKLKPNSSKIIFLDNE